MTVVANDHVGAVKCDLGRFLSGEIEAEAEEDLRTLPDLGFLRHFVDAEFLAADRAFPASVSQCIEPCALGTVRAEEVAKVPGGYQVAVADNHCWSVERPLKTVSIVLSGDKREKIIFDGRDRNLFFDIDWISVNVISGGHLTTSGGSPVGFLRRVGSLTSC